MTEGPLEKRPFRLSPQVGVMIAVVLVALALPVAVVVLFVRTQDPTSTAVTVGEGTNETPESAAANSEALRPLRQSLEVAAAAAWNGATASLDEGLEVKVVGAALPGKVERMKQLVSDLGGTMLEMEDEPALKRWRVTVPAGAAEAFRRGMLGGDDESAGTGKINDAPEGTERMIEVRIVVLDAAGNP